MKGPQVVFKTDRLWYLGPPHYLMWKENLQVPLRLLAARVSLWLATLSSGWLQLPPFLTRLVVLSNRPLMRCRLNRLGGLMPIRLRNPNGCPHSLLLPWVHLRAPPVETKLKLPSVRCLVVRARRGCQRLQWTRGLGMMIFPWDIPRVQLRIPKRSHSSPTSRSTSLTSTTTSA